MDELTTINYQDTLDKVAAIEAAANNISDILEKNNIDMKSVRNEWDSDAATETEIAYENLKKSYNGAKNVMSACTKHVRDVVDIHKEVDRVMKEKAREMLETIQ